MRSVGAALLVLAALVAPSHQQVTDWMESAPNKNPPPQVEQAESHKHPAFQRFHRDKMWDIKGKMEQIAEVQTHLEDLLDRIGEKREKVVVKETVGDALDRHQKAERQYLEEESERRIRGVMEGKQVAPMSYDTDDIVDDVAPQVVGKPKDAREQILAEHAKKVEEAKKAFEEAKGTPQEAAALARLNDAKLPPSMVPAFDCAKAEGEAAKERCIKDKAKAEEAAARVEAAREAQRNLATAQESGNPKLIAAAAEQVKDAAAALHPGQPMPQTVTREIERVRWMVREKAEAERKEKAKEAVQDLVEKAVEKREEEKSKVAQVVEQRKKLIENLRTRQQEAEAMKEKAQEMLRQARAAKLLAEAKLTEQKGESKQLTESLTKMQDVTTDMAKMNQKTNEGIKKLLDVQPDF